MDKQATKTEKNVRRNNRNNSTSIYFLLWSVFTALSLLIVLLVGLSQWIITTQTYKREAARELQNKGPQIQTQLENPPVAAGGNISAHLRYLSTVYDVNVFILSENGDILFPQFPDFEENADESFNMQDNLKILQERLASQQAEFAVYEGANEYVYGAEISLYGSQAYLYVGKSLHLINASVEQLGLRLLFTSLFVFLLSFAVTGGVSGWLTKPITEMTKKASQLAKGDFAVDFHGADYGSEMVELADTLNYARDELSKLDGMQKELIANVSHDFKTPLTMIKAYASMIMEISGDIPEKRNRHAHVIFDEADRLASLVGDVLELSKMHSGLETFNVTEFDMSAYLHELLSRFDYLTETQGYRFVVDIQDELYTRGDELKIGQVLYNLIGNAVNYTGDDKTVKVTLQKSGGDLIRFAVTDTGAGIKPEDIPTIWERYYRSSETHKRPVKGTGLGLSIVKAVLQRHGFVFGVESEIGKGSTFFVDFPLIDLTNN